MLFHLFDLLAKRKKINNLILLIEDEKLTLTISLRIKFEIVFNAAKRTLSDRSRKQP